MSDAAIGQIIAGVLALATIVGGFYIQGRQMDKLKETTTKTAAIINDPKTGVVATHEIVNSQSEQLKKALEKSEAALIASNRQLEAVNAERLKDSQAREGGAGIKVSAETIKAVAGDVMAAGVEIADPTIRKKAEGLDT